jgi:hemoglobin
MEPAVESTKPLYDRLGGKAAIDATVDRFYEKVIADPTLRRFFDRVDMKAQKGKQKAFLAMVFGGPVKYTGKDLRAGHANAVKQGLRDAHFDAVAGHLKSALTELGVPSNLIGEVMAIAGSTRNDVLNR